MSLSAATIINNIQAPNRDGVVSSLSSLSNAPSGLFFRTDVNRLTYIPVVPYSNQSIRFWEPAAGVDEDYLNLGIADADQPPTAGTTALEYDGDTSGLTAVSATITAANLQTAINANPTVIATGQTVALTEIADRVFQIDWSGTGAKEFITGTGSGLIPESNVFTAWIREGDGSTNASQLLQFIQRPLVFVDSWTAGGAPDVTVTELVTGAEGVKAMFQVAITGLLYEGTFTVDGSAAIAFNASGSDMLTALGTGWGSVVKTADGLYTIERATAGVYTLEDSDIDISALKSFGHFTGTLGFNKAALFQRFAAIDGDSFVTSLQIRHDDGTNSDTLLFIPVTLHKDILSPAATAPTNWSALFYTKAQTDALIADFTEGPASSINNNLAAFDGTDGKLLEDSGVAVSTDGTMASNSNTKLPTEAAIVTYVAARTAGLLDLKGSTDCSANPNYPAASKGDAYYVSVAGKIGGASGVVVAVGDVYFALADNAGGDEATVGTSWSALNYNLVAATELVAGIIPIADNAKVDAETDDASAMTVLKTLRLYNNQVALQNAVQTLSPTGTTQTVDFNDGGYVKLDLTGATGHVTLTLSNPIPGKEYVFEVLDDSTTRNLIFPAGTTQSLDGGATWVSSGVSNIDLIGVRWNGTVYRIAGTSPDHS